MTRSRSIAVFPVVFLVASVLLRAAGAPPQAVTGAASSAATASPELVGALSKELGVRPEQAAGAAGALFGLAQTRLKAEEFSQVANAVPGMASLLKAAPAAGSSGQSSAIAQLAGQATGLAGVAANFSKLGLKPEMVAKAVPVLVSFVTKSGGAGVGNLLAGALK